MNKSFAALIFVLVDLELEVASSKNTSDINEGKFENCLKVTNDIGFQL